MSKQNRTKINNINDLRNMMLRDLEDSYDGYMEIDILSKRSTACINIIKSVDSQVKAASVLGSGINKISFLGIELNGDEKPIKPGKLIDEFTKP